MDLEESFRTFDQENPRVYELFKLFTFQTIRAGHQHFSADAIVHRIRWETNVITNAQDPYKINNNHVSYYARKFMNDFPERKGFFRIRATDGERTAA